MLNNRRTTRVIWRTVVAAAAMLAAPACAGQNTPAQEPVATPAPVEPVTEVQAPAPTPAVAPAPEPAPAPAMIRVTVETEPAGADVYLDGKLVGSSPVQIEVPAGSAELNVRVSRDGYADEERVVTADADQSLQVSMKAKRIRGVGRHKTGRGFILS